MAGPWDELGVPAGTPWPDVRARWLALVKQLHPDRHADPTAAARLARVNAAYGLLSEARKQQGEHGRETPEGEAVMFTVSDFRPVVFDALVLAAADVGDVTDTDEPFSLELFVEGPPPGFCRVELVPEAGGSIVTLDSEQVDAAGVADVLVAALVRLGLDAARHR